MSRTSLASENMSSRMLSLLPKRIRFSVLVPTVLALALACGEENAQEGDAPPEPNAVAARLTVEELPPMPSYPTARQGRLVTLSAGDYDIHGTWRTQAGLCDQPGIMEIYAGPTGNGTALLIRLPEGDPVGEYPIVAAAREFPDPPVALLAVQVFDDPDAFGFQAYHGLLELTEIGEDVSGRFTATLREIGTDVLAHYVGVFESIPVTPLPPEYCKILRDSTFSSDSAMVSDSTSGGG